MGTTTTTKTFSLKEIVLQIIKNQTALQTNCSLMAVIMTVQAPPDEIGKTVETLINEKKVKYTDASGKRFKAI